MRCPGQDKRYWGYDAIYEVRCPKCGEKVELFKDEIRAKCKKCGHIFVNPKVKLGCAVYCKYAAQCLGGLSPELIEKRDEFLKDRVALEVKRHLGKDFKRIGHMVKVARFAEAMAMEEDVMMPAVLIASYLQELNDLNTSKIVLDRLGAREEIRKKVLEILEKLPSAGPSDPMEVKVVHDAISLAEGKNHRNTLFTDSAKRIAKEGGKV